jgi:oligopeptidase A
MNNPLLEKHSLPPFSRIAPEHVVPAIRQLLDENRVAIDRLLASDQAFGWDNLAQPLEDLDDRLNKAWSPVGHMNAVVNSDALREAYNTCLPLLSEYATEIGQNQRLFEAYQRIAESEEFVRLDAARRKIIANALRDFRLSGIALPEEKKARFKEIAQQLSRLSSRFADNLLDATQAWEKHIEDESLLSGIPESDRAVAREMAESRGEAGWLFTLEFPSYNAVMTYADDPELRRELYTAYSTRASDQGPLASRWDNTDIMEKILALRHEEAQLLGYQNYAELSLVTKMAKTPGQVVRFLEDLAARSRPVAERDLEELRRFAQEQHGVESLQAWDLAYYSEKLRQYKYALSQEEIKAYFPVDRVISGLFALVERLYGLKVEEREGVDTWHPDVRFFEIRDNDGELRGSFYLDLYARPNKRGGAWMDECIARRKLAGTIQIPVAYLTCNFTPPVADDTPRLKHDEVLTLFHEFGHGLHHLLTKMDYLGVSGIHGVEWDAVELPSQFMENFCWAREALELISGHYESGEALPDELLDKMLAARNFQSGMQMVRQLEFSLFDFLIHLEYDPVRGGRIYETLDRVRRAVAVFVPPAFSRLAHSFSHIFAGGYAAGYYSYKWAEVLSSDAYSLFEETGVLNPKTGHSFLASILEKGGSQDAIELFQSFRGREPQIDALLRHNGIAA